MYVCVCRQGWEKAEGGVGGREEKAAAAAAVYIAGSLFEHTQSGPPDLIVHC